MNYTHHELERISYIQGNGLANLYEEASLVESLVEAEGDASIHIDEAKGSFPKEDFLQEAINELLVMAQSRVTKSDVIAFAENLKDLQDEIARQSEYGIDELRKAQGLLK